MWCSFWVWWNAYALCVDEHFFRYVEQHHPCQKDFFLKSKSTHAVEKLEKMILKSCCGPILILSTTMKTAMPWHLKSILSLTLYNINTVYSPGSDKFGSWAWPWRGQSNHTIVLAYWPATQYQPTSHARASLGRCNPKLNLKHLATILRL